MHTLDWKHAWAGRLLTTAPTRPQALKLLEPQLDSCNARLIGEVASGKLPFLNLPFRSSLTARLKALTPRLRRFRHMVVLGIGGSALGTRALQKAFFPQQDLPNHQGPWLWILDNVDADVLEAQMSALNPEETIVVPVSKSGGTIETLAQYFFMKAWLQKALPDTWHEHMLLVTDEKKGYLREEADRHNIVSLPVPDHLGGRYSVISAVGLVPAAFMGLPWEDFLEGAACVNAPLVNDELGKPEALRSHPAWALANWCFELSRHDYSQLVFFTYIPSWASFGQWFGQLWAESLGKNGKGTMPLPAVGVTDQHSLQQMFLDGPADKGCIQLHCPNLNKGPRFPDGVPDSWGWLRGKAFGDLLNAETLGSAAALVHNGVPLTRLEVAESSMSRGRSHGAAHGHDRAYRLAYEHQPARPARRGARQTPCLFPPRLLQLPGRSRHLEGVSELGDKRHRGRGKRFRKTVFPPPSSTARSFSLWPCHKIRLIHLHGMVKGRLFPPAFPSTGPITKALRRLSF